MSFRVYDNDGKTLDRYTVVIDGPPDARGYVEMLGLSPGGHSVSQWTEGQEGRHLGKRVDFNSLDADTARHILGRLS
jgi:hypothetical protein